MCDKMLDKVRQTINAYEMLCAGEKVLVGLSGGADSVSLALCLKKLGFAVCCVHVDHGLRGEESDRDREFCKEFCVRHGFELLVYSPNVKKYCEENKLSTELGARKLRYDAFEQAADRFLCEKIATAHTLSDCLETTLLNLTRGAGVKGLSGIPPVRGRYVRPLIDCTRAEIEEFLVSLGEKYVNDSTNFVDDCSRNIIRLNVLPQLERINSGIMKSYLSTVKVLRETGGYIWNLTEGAINSAKLSNNSYKTDALLACDEFILENALSQIIKDACGESSFERIADVVNICKNGGKITLPHDVYAESSHGILKFYKQADAAPEFQSQLVIGEYMHFFDKGLLCKKYIVEEYLKENDNVHKKFTNYQIDYDKIKGSVFVRNRRSGDKIKLSGRDFTSSVKTLFNAAVPMQERSKVLFLCDSEGIIFIEGFGCAGRVKCTDSTKNILEIKINTKLSQ